MGYLSIFFISFAIALSGALAPGPLLSAVIAKSIHYGSKTGPTVILGHAILEILMVIIIIFGLSNFINTPGIIKIVSIAGTIILIIFFCSNKIDAQETLEIYPNVMIVEELLK